MLLLKVQAARLVCQSPLVQLNTPFVCSRVVQSPYHHKVEEGSPQDCCGPVLVPFQLDGVIDQDPSGLDSDQHTVVVPSLDDRRGGCRRKVIDDNHDQPLLLCSGYAVGGMALSVMAFLVVH